MLTEIQRKTLKDAINKLLQEMFGGKADVNGNLDIPIQNTRAMNIGGELRVKFKDELNNNK